MRMRILYVISRYTKILGPIKTAEILLKITDAAFWECSETTKAKSHFEEIASFNPS